MLIAILLAGPLIGGLVIFFMRDRYMKIPFIINLMIFLSGGLLLNRVFRGDSLNYSIDSLPPFKLVFQADGLSAIFVLLAAFLWFVVAIYSPKYMDYEGKTWSFQLCTMFTLFAVLGIFLAGNLATMLLFFELMTITSYFWVIHRFDKGAIRAGYFYLFFSIFGGLVIALGIVMMGAATEVLPQIGSGMVKPLDPKLFSFSIILFLIGFGIKAGMVPLHLWLPYAHSVAPTPGSGLLSGLLIKVGAYGLIRTGEFAGFGVNLGIGMDWLGPTIIILGTFTMLLGVLAALIQSNAKKLLAYHSISQMGYIILGLGVALYLGSDGGLGLTGAIYHIINHALFKIALFLGVGVIYISTGETDLYKLGGLWRRFPFTAVLMFLAVLGITGAPGLNGYASKSLLHHGVSLAAEMGDSWIIWIERLFLIVGVGTAASFSKLYYLMFLGEKTKLEIKEEKAPSLQIAMTLLSIVMLGIGIRPDFLLNNFIVPASENLGMGGISSSLMGLSFWNFSDISGMIITLVLGVLVCWAGLKTGAFHLHLPKWMTIEGLVGIGYEKICILSKRILKAYSSLLDKIKDAISNMISHLYGDFSHFDKSNTSTVFGVNLMGIGADVGILVIILGFLIGLYVIINPSIYL